MKTINAPKPQNFDALARTWNDPEAHARELARYYEQLRSENVLEVPVDRTEPRRGRD